MSYTHNAAISHDLRFNNELVKAGAFLKIKGLWGLVRYECIIHNKDNGKDYLLVHIGSEKKMVGVERLMYVATLKRSRWKTD